MFVIEYESNSFLIKCIAAKPNLQIQHIIIIIKSLKIIIAL